MPAWTASPWCSSGESKRLPASPSPRASLREHWPSRIDSWRSSGPCPVTPGEYRAGQSMRVTSDHAPRRPPPRPRACLEPPCLRAPATRVTSKAGKRWAPAKPSVPARRPRPPGIALPARALLELPRCPSPCSSLEPPRRRIRQVCSGEGMGAGHVVRLSRNDRRRKRPN
jgi:hypothetical protein